MALEVRRLGDRAPPARRIASCARSYVCFGPVISGGIGRGRFGACRDIAPNKQNGRARLSRALLARNRRRSERSSRCAARAALDFSNGITSTANMPGHCATSCHAVWRAMRHGFKGMALEVRRLGDRAPPARRIASCARSYVCFGPVISGGFARGRFGACRDIAPNKQNGRARLSRAYWPEIDVGASAARDAPRGRRSISATA